MNRKTWDESRVLDGFYNVWINPSQISVLGLTGAISGSAMAILSENTSIQMTGFALFVLWRLFDLLDGKYARYLMWKQLWSSELCGDALDAHCDKAGIYLSLSIFLAKNFPDSDSLKLIIPIVIMLALDIQSTLMRKTDWSKVWKSIVGWRHLFSWEKAQVGHKRNKANWSGKTKTVMQTVGTGGLLLNERFPQAWIIAIALFVWAIAFSILSLLKKQKLKTA